MSRDRYKIHQKQFPHFITGTIVNWLPLFSNPDIVKIILDSLKFRLENHEIKLYSYVIMENHLHFVTVDLKVL